MDRPPPILSSPLLTGQALKNTDYSSFLPSRTFSLYVYSFWNHLLIHIFPLINLFFQNFLKFIWFFHSFIPSFHILINYSLRFSYFLVSFLFFLFYWVEIDVFDDINVLFHIFNFKIKGDRFSTSLWIFRSFRCVDLTSFMNVDWITFISTHFFCANYKKCHDTLWRLRISPKFQSVISFSENTLKIPWKKNPSKNTQKHLYLNIDPKKNENLSIDSFSCKVIPKYADTVFLFF